jgi:hypothetical protein
VLPEDRPVDLLRSHFFQELLENDLLSDDGAGHAYTTFWWTLAVLPGLFACVLLMFRYFNPLDSPPERLLLALPDKTVIVSYPMLTMALLALLKWDALQLTARDRLILGPLPVAPSLLLRAKLMALAQFAMVFGAAVNVIPALVYPGLLLGAMPVGLDVAARVFAVHAVVCFAASVFGFLAILTTRAACALLPGRGTFAAASSLVQLLGIVVVTGALLVLPAVPSRNTMQLLSVRTEVAQFIPTMWFLGVYERLSSDAILLDPRTRGASARGLWTAQDEASARKAYVELSPTLVRLATTAVGALAAALVTAFALFALSARHSTGTRLADSGVPVGGRALSLLARAVSRNPVTQAGFLFTCQVVARSARHRLHLGAYLAAGLATAAVLLVPRMIAAAPSAELRDRPILALQMVLSFFVLAGLRASFAKPAVPQAGWIFEISWTGDVRHYKAGVARAVAVIVGPTFVGLLPFHVFWLGWRVALTHAVAGWLFALLASEWVVLRRWGVPFVTAISDKTANPAPRVSLFVIAFVAYALGFAALEDRAIHVPGGLEWLTFILLILLVAAMTVRHVQSRVSDRRSLRGADHEPSLQTLGMTAEP